MENYSQYYKEFVNAVFDIAKRINEAGIPPGAALDFAIQIIKLSHEVTDKGDI